MYNTKAVDFGGSWIFFKKSVDDCLPAVIRVSKLQGIVQQCQMAFQNASSEKGTLTYVIEKDPISHLIPWHLSFGPLWSNFQTTPALI